jgi:hypothetical protein
MLIACQFDPYAYEFTRAKPEVTSLPGHYRTDDESRKIFKREFNIDVSQCELDLRDDGSFDLRGVPDCWKEIDCSGKLQRTSGTWTLGRHQEWWALRLRTSRIDGSAADFGSDAMLRRETPPYLVHFTIGDPDSGHALAFERDR